MADIIVVAREVYANPNAISTLAHEIGHYFGLEHTHRNATKGLCRAECVSRTRNFPWQCLKAGNICEKNGDALCDTPADPELVWDNVNKVSEFPDCTYNWGETDNFGDAYAPDETNIMSYSVRRCRTTFSAGQTWIMAHNMLHGRGGLHYGFDYGETDADRYEPDDSDFPGVPRPIIMGETQCHSFHDMSQCQDPTDWLSMEVNNDIIGSYRIIVEKISDEPSPVEVVRVWNIGGDGFRSTQLATTFTAIGSTLTYEFPCDVSATNGRLLIEVVRNTITEGKYTITLTSSRPLSISGDNVICQATSYELEGLGIVGSTTINWTSSPSITLQNTTGTTVNLQSIAGGSNAYWIEVTVTSGTCQQVIRKTFTQVGMAGIPDFNIVEEIHPCFAAEGQYSLTALAPDINYTWTCSGPACGSIQSFGEFANVEPHATGTLNLTVTATDKCGNSLVKTLTTSIQKCPDMMRRILITPNPTSGQVSVEVDDTYETEGTYQVYIVNQMSELKYQAEYPAKEFSINLGELQNGLYNILVYRDATSASASFIVNK